MRLFKNRHEAANELAGLVEYLKPEQPIVLGIPNGGVVLAEIIATRLEAPLEILLIQRLAAPKNPDHIVGAVDEHGRISMIQTTARWHHLTSKQMVEPARAAFRELQRRRANFRAVLPEAEVRGRTVVLVDEGVQTGATLLAAVSSVRDRGAGKVVVAAPAGPGTGTWQLHDTADEVVIPHSPAKFKGIAHFYEEFPDVRDSEIVELLKRWVSDRPELSKGVQTLHLDLKHPDGGNIHCQVEVPPSLQRNGAQCPAVIFCHGFESNANSERSVPISRRLAKRGVMGVRMDFTGHGRSEGTAEEATEAQMLADLRLVFNAVMDLAEVDDKRVGLCGAGTGGMIALRFAAQEPRVDSLVVRGPVCGREVVTARGIQAPTLLIHAERDTALREAIDTIDHEMAATHELLVIPDSNRLFGDPISRELMVSASVDWLADHLKVPVNKREGTHAAQTYQGE